MGLTTLCYIEKDNAYLMLHRVSKKNDVNKDKWIGVGGHFEEGESPEECLLREVKEETGLTLTKYRFRGLVTFLCEGWETEYMCLYTADGFFGTMTDCDEGTLEWVEKSRLSELNLWEGDYLFFRLIEEDRPFFSLKLQYQQDHLKSAVLDGKEILPENMRGAMEGAAKKEMTKDE
ncbi:MAG: 8-oxo-dGTP diphosphatase [Eubacteriales bacterium]|nr:8-oxo-dGTP diphosphatase [Eubacteriales bacterium]